MQQGNQAMSTVVHGRSFKDGIREGSTYAQKLVGQTVSPGAVVGRLLFFQNDLTLSRPGPAPVMDAEQELTRFKSHIDFLVGEIAEAVEILERESAGEQADILRTHLYLIKDPAFHRDVRQEICEHGRAAETAIEVILTRMITTFENSENDLFRQRASDIRDILSRLSRRINQQSRKAFQALRDRGAIVLATRELLPSVVLEARNSSVVGFVVERGTGLSHAAILAKSLGFPVLRIDDLNALQWASDEQILVDATNGEIVVSPSPETILEGLESASAGRRIDRDSLPVRLWINIADPSQVSPSHLERVQGVGLYRTEVLFMEQTDDFPSEQQQYEVYRSLFQVCPSDYPITVRTADIGGDKTLPYFSLGPQENPYLGVRAHRIYREHPEIFIIQMRAILRAAAGASGLRIMYPMIGSLEDLSFVQSLLAEAVRSLKARGQDYQSQFQQGIMIEVPSAAWNCEELLKAVDFASVGTNDLLQYFFAVAGDDAGVSQSYRAQDPIALQMLKRIVDAAARVGKPLSICGEIASDPQLVPLLVGLGFKDLSVDMHFLAQVEDLVSTLDAARCEQLADKCLKARSSEEVRKLVNSSDLTRSRNGNGGTSGRGASSRGLVMDPVCEMMIDLMENDLAALCNGRIVHFCSVACRDEYFLRR
jgi:phosphoenolpyruvate-protein phosphotransferase